ncbi:MAG: hypothetical protein PHN37_02530 [Candidatus Pacebacteria bacterium]|nr:hypothetical protein [Candidatus Paceibacterota bacterium]
MNRRIKERIRKSIVSFLAVLFLLNGVPLSASTHYKWGDRNLGRDPFGDPTNLEEFLGEGKTQRAITRLGLERIPEAREFSRTTLPVGTKFKTMYYGSSTGGFDHKILSNVIWVGPSELEVFLFWLERDALVVPLACGNLAITDNLQKPVIPEPRPEPEPIAIPIEPEPQPETVVQEEPKIVVENYVTIVFQQQSPEPEIVIEEQEIKPVPRRNNAWLIGAGVVITGGLIYLLTRGGGSRKIGPPIVITK